MKGDRGRHTARNIIRNDIKKGLAETDDVRVRSEAVHNDIQTTNKVIV